MEFRNGREFFLADAYWFPPQAQPVGPMALEVSCQVVGPGTSLRVRQTATENGIRWQRYYDLIAAGWQDSISSLKRYLEAGAEPKLPPCGIVQR